MWSCGFNTLKILKKSVFGREHWGFMRVLCMLLPASFWGPPLIILEFIMTKPDILGYLLEIITNKSDYKLIT